MTTATISGASPAHKAPSSLKDKQPYFPLPLPFSPFPHRPKTLNHNNSSTTLVVRKRASSIKELIRLPQLRLQARVSNHRWVAAAKIKTVKEEDQVGVEGVKSTF